MKEVVIIMGFPCSGKSTFVKEYIDKGFKRLNRDDVGLSLDSLNVTLDTLLASGGNGKIVLDNTYGKKSQREAVIAVADRYGCKKTCVWLTTRIEDAQFNSSWRILGLPETQNKPPQEVLGPNGSKDFPSPDNVPAIALFAYKKSFEKPSKEEGWDEIIKKDFVRVMPSDFINKAIILDYDGTLREMVGKLKYPTHPSEVKVIPNRANVLKKYQDDGFLLLGVSNQSGIEKGEITASQAEACFEETNKQLGLDIDYLYCPHHSFPIRCYCRKPMPGLGVYLIKQHKLNPSKCLFVGDATSDKTFASRSGMQFRHADEFFKQDGQ